MPKTTRLLLIVASVLAAGQVRAQDESESFAQAARLLQSRCAMPGCHAGPSPAQGLLLEAAQIYRSTVNVPSRTDRRLLRVSPGAADQSLLYLKLLDPDQGRYRGPRMPLAMDPLPDEQIALIRRWIESFPAGLWGAPPIVRAAEAAPRVFHDTFLSNLPTPDTLGKKTLEFRILHRFKPSAPDAGGAGLYGLDGGAWISFGLGYGLADALDVGLRRTNLQVDYEAYAKWSPLRQGVKGAPLSLSLRASGSSARDETFANRNRWAAQAIVGRRFGRHVSAMLLPTYVTRTNSADAADTGGTGAVGVGAEVRLSPRFAITGELVNQTSGVKAPFKTGALGFSIITARHVFHLVATNVEGAHTDLYVPGGDLDPGDGDFRIGFNISRTYALGH